MPDTSAAGNDWSGVGTALSAFAIGLLVWLGNRMAGKDQAKSPVTPLPEVAGVSMALIDQKVQATIAKDTERTAVACEAMRDAIETFIKDAEEERERKEERDREKLERDNEDLRRQLYDARRGAGTYTTSPRPKDLMRDE